MRWVINIYRLFTAICWHWERKNGLANDEYWIQWILIQLSQTFLCVHCVQRCMVCVGGYTAAMATGHFVDYSHVFFGSLFICSFLRLTRLLFNSAKSTIKIYDCCASSIQTHTHNNEIYLFHQHLIHFNLLFYVCNVYTSNAVDRIIGIIELSTTRYRQFKHEIKLKKSNKRT